MPARAYVDTSVYLCVLLGQAGSSSLKRELAGARLLSSSLLAIEAYRTLVRLSREKLLSPAEFQDALDRLESDLDAFQLRDLTLDLCRDRAMPVLSTPRTLDLAHLRTAVWFHEIEPLDRFASLDRGQTIAARELGLPV